jgi:hypothetical protein
MNKVIASILLAAVTTLAHAQAAGPVTVPATERCTAFAQTLTGNTYDATVEARVREQNFSARVVARDQARYPATMDYRPDRINFELESGKVAHASCG